VAKKRVYDLAKEYGMSGQELAQKLRDLGFQVKSHMSALDDFQVLEIQARLEAYGIVGGRTEEASQGVTTVGGLKIKRRKKKPPADEAEPPAPPAVEEPAEPAEEALASSPEPAPEPTSAAAPEPTSEPAPEPSPGEPAEIAPSDEGSAGGETEVSEPVLEEPEPAAAEAAEPTAEAPAPAPEPAPVTEPTIATDGPATESPDQQETPAAKVPPEAAAAESEVVRPSKKRKGGKVVGFIDPSQFKQAPVRRTQSRRLRSSDDVLPNVMPTFGRDRGPGQVRGDTTRGTLTAQQLREREAGRFLRRRRAQQGGGPGRRAGGARPAAGPTGSPFAGSSVPIETPITIKKLANTLAVKENQFIRAAFQQLGFGITINSLIDEETALLLAQEFDVELQVTTEIAAEEQLLSELEKKRAQVGEADLLQRSPTVAFLGHVDHGKTTLIDTIRHSRIANAESGGITQHIGAYQVKTRAGNTLSIIDTPGHAAFTSMRARGAQAVDVVVLVVAADDGVKPQTEEALNHAKAAGTPIVVALNKCDKPEANPDMVMNQLAGLGLTPEDWGGDTAMLKVSALKGDGLEDLLDRVFLESEVLELKSNPEGPASGVVLEAEIQQGKGKVAHLLLQDGTLKKGDVILAGDGYGKVRSIHHDRGRQIKSAVPSQPVEVTGLNELPTAGDHFYVVDSLDRAHEVAQERSRHSRQMSQIERREISRENILEAVADQEKPSINLIVKADVQGSVEVLKHQISEMKHDEMQVNLIHAGVGQVLESDVDLAVTSAARILAFHTSAHTRVRQAAERHGVDIKAYDVIYELLDDIRKLMEGELAPEVKEEITGHVEIRRIFKSSKIGNIAGCYVLDGKVSRGSKLRLLRDGNVVFTGEIGTLRREKDDAKDVREGFECGIVIKNYNDIRVGDVVEAYRLFEVKRTL